jgi:myosin heavy subunit
MADGIQGLFTTPEQYQIMQQQAAQNRALGFAQMNPLERIDYSAYMAGNQLADVAARGLGGQDKQLTLISQRQALSKQIDPANPESILAAAQQAAQSGDQQFALTLADYARKSQSEIALAQQRMREGKNAVAPAIQLAEYKGGLESQLTQLKAMDQNDPQVKLATQTVQSRLSALPVEKGSEATSEIKNAQAMAALKGVPGSTTYNTEFETQLARLTGKSVDLTNEVKNARAIAETYGKPGEKAYDEKYQQKLTELTAAKQGGLKEVGVAEGTRKAVFVDPSTDQQYVYDTDNTGKQIRVPYSGAIDRLTSKTDVKVSAGEKRANRFMEGLDDIALKRVSSAVEKRESAIASNNNLTALEALAKKPLIGSPLADNILSATNLLNSIGLLSEQDKTRMSSSEQYDKLAKDAVLANLGKLSAGISDADRQFMDRIVPQLTTSPAARLALINYMRDKNNRAIAFGNRIEKYASEKGNLIDFKTEEEAKPSSAGGNDAAAKAARRAQLIKDLEAAKAREAAKGSKK